MSSILIIGIIIIGVISIVYIMTDTKKESPKQIIKQEMIKTQRINDIKLLTLHCEGLFQRKALSKNWRMPL